MRFKKTIIFIFLSTIYLHSFSEKGDTIQYKIDFLKKYFLDDKSWQVTDSVYSRNIEELINFIQKKPVNVILNNLEIQNALSDSKISRLPENVSDTLKIQGFIFHSEVIRKKEEIRKTVIEEFLKNDLQVPVGILTGIEKKVQLIPQEEGMSLIVDSIYSLPDSLRFLDAIPDSMVQTAEDFQRILKLDSIRDILVERYRKHYNDSIVGAYRDSLLSVYSNVSMEDQVQKRINQYTDSVKMNNYNLIKSYNDTVIREVNDSLQIILSDLVEYVNSIDTVNIKIRNLVGESKNLTLGSNRQQFTRVWLKNEQNDSISILISNEDKRSIKMLINDNVTFSRMSQKQSKEFSIANLNPSTNLVNVRKRYKVETPWSIGGDGTIGITQTYLSNWKKGEKVLFRCCWY